MLTLPNTLSKRGWWLALTWLAATPAAADEQAPVMDGVRVVTVAAGLDHPWGLAFLPDGRMLVTERPGRMRLVEKDGRLSEPLPGLPDIYASGQGGLLDVALDPDFEKSKRVYFSFSESGDGGIGTAVARAVLDDSGLSDVQVIFSQQPKTHGSNHFGSRLVFAKDGNLFVTLGERYHLRDQAQKLDNHLGKIVRIRPDGSAPAGNPFMGKAGMLPAIWSYGHRNVQGAALHPRTGQLWIHEHGPKGGDEINIIAPGKNYGWPVISYGVDYSGLPIAEGTARDGMEQPLHYWDPSIAPCGMMFYTGDKFPGWKHDIFLGALKGVSLIRLVFKGQTFVKEERLLTALDERIRDVRTGPDGYIYLLTDSSQGRILRLEPSAPR